MAQRTGFYKWEATPDVKALAKETGVKYNTGQLRDFDRMFELVNKYDANLAATEYYLHNQRHIANIEGLSFAFAIGMISKPAGLTNKGDGEFTRFNLEGTSKTGESLTSLYRAVGPDEFYDVMKTGEFNVIPNGLQAKQFGLSFEETLKFADKYSDIGAIIEVKVPTSVLNKIGDFTQVDKFIFKSGTVTIHADKLGEFNKIIQELIHKY